MVNVDKSIDGSGADFGLLFWESSKATLDSFTAALSPEGFADLLPEAPSKRAALKETLADYITSAGIRKRGEPITPHPLSENVVGFEARRILRGDTENQYTFVMSVVADENDRVHIAKWDSDELPALGYAVSNAEYDLTAAYRDKLKWLPTTVATGILNKLAEAVGGTPVKGKGGFWWVPAAAAQRLSPVFNVLEMEETGPKFTTVVFPLAPSESSYRSVIESLREEVRVALVEIEESLATLGEKRQRSNGVATRLKRVEELQAKIARYEALLGTAMPELSDACKRVSDAVNAHAAMEFCA